MFLNEDKPDGRYHQHDTLFITYFYDTQDFEYSDHKGRMTEQECRERYPALDLDETKARLKQ